MRYEELSDEIQKLTIENGVVWDEYKGVYFTKLHKEFYLKENEAKTEEYLKEFCNMIKYLKTHLEYGVSTEWADSELNKYVYKKNKTNLKERFPKTIDALFRFNQDSDIIAFYKRELKATDPTIIDLVGTTGAGKTTFCQQFVDEKGKEILSKTITASGNSTIIQTDIAILENTKNRLFLKARSKSDIIRDLILVALNIDSGYKFDVKKNITDMVNKAGVKKDTEKEIKVDSDLFQGVYNLFRTTKLLGQFQKIAKDLQLNFTKEDNIQKYISNNIANENLTKLLDDIIYSELKIDNFYGYRHEISLDQKNILEKTIIPTKTFNKYKEEKEEFKDIISYRLLFEQAILVLKCDEKAKQSLPEKFKKGVVFRDSQGHKKSEQVGIATDFEVKNKILLIPAGTGGELVDDKFVEELKNIIISEPKQNIVVITKIDKASSYEQYTQDTYDSFIETLKEQIVTTHNNLIGRLEETEQSNVRQVYKFDRNTMAKKFIAAFDNAYLSKITKAKEGGGYDAELHRIVCKNKSNQEISASDIEDVALIDNWHTLVSSILERENKVSYDMGSINFKNIDNKKNKEKLMLRLSGNIEGMLSICIDDIKWGSDLDRALSIYSKDFRNIYNECYMWNYRAFKKDVSTSGYNIEEKVAKVIKDINSLVTVKEEKNAVEVILEFVLLDYLMKTYTFDKRLDVANIAKRIIANAISRATMISYKLYDRVIMDNSSLENVEIIFNNPIEYIQPMKDIKQYDISKRSYYTDTAYFLGVYCNLLSKFKYNLETYFVDIFKTVIESELEKLDEKVK